MSKLPLARISLLILIIIGTVFSCQKEEKEKVTIDVQFHYTVDKTVYPLFYDSLGSNNIVKDDLYRIEVDLRYPTFYTENEAFITLVDSLNFQVKKWIFDSKSRTSMLNSYQLDEKDKNLLGPQNWHISRSVDVKEVTSKFVGLSYDFYEFTGGAHGISSTLYSNIDTENGSQIDIKTFLGEDVYTEVLKNAEASFRQVKNIPPDESLNKHGYYFVDDQFYLADNILICPSGLLMVFNPYEIAPYAEGDIELFIPYDSRK